MNKERIIDVCRWTLGGVFSFSGIVKCVDPVGTAVFVEKYLATFSLDVLLPRALPLAVVLSVAEFTLTVIAVLPFEIVAVHALPLAALRPSFASVRLVKFTSNAAVPFRIRYSSFFGAPVSDRLNKTVCTAADACDDIHDIICPCRDPHADETVSQLIKFEYAVFP